MELSDFPLLKPNTERERKWAQERARALDRYAKAERPSDEQFTAFIMDSNAVYQKETGETPWEGLWLLVNLFYSCPSVSA